MHRLEEQRDVGHLKTLTSGDGSNEAETAMPPAVNVSDLLRDLFASLPPLLNLLRFA